MKVVLLESSLPSYNPTWIYGEFIFDEAEM